VTSQNAIHPLPHHEGELTMRFKSKPSNGYQVFAVSGVNTISFGINANDASRKGLLGFAVERVDKTENERRVMPGFKVFRSVVPHPTEKTQVSTWDHPIQSFVWDDFTAKPEHSYQYIFHPLKGTPKNIDRSTKPIPINVETEPLFSKNVHDVFFNRGVASSQAYQRRFGDLRPDELPTDKGKEAIQWLTRELDDAILKFIKSAKKGDSLHGCFYEFRYLPVAEAFKQAIDRGVDVRLIVDGKVNEHKDPKTGEMVESFPREDNLRTIKKARLPRKNITLRQAIPTKIQHNKFIVLLRKGKPKEVWTGSTNISLGGFSGQTNVGHWVKDKDVAEQFEAYWQLLKTDPGAIAGLERAEANKANKALRDAVGKLRDVPESLEDVEEGVTTVFSPRAGLKVLDLYVNMVDSASACSCITLAFGINEEFKNQLVDNDAMNAIVFMLLEKKDAPNSRSKKPFVGLSPGQNVYQAWGSFIDDPVYQWAKETNNRILQLNSHVAYIHSKFLLRDPLGDDPHVVTGSANFSKASTNDNDENMIIIRGDKRVADIYFTEFNRLFNHYYFRSVAESLKKQGQKLNTDASLFLCETAEPWLKKYKPGTLRSKRLALYTKMHGAQVL
jgi:phosphatidylserine/phosphatidylglycerophosphate/cardiolipin synthase-like enzyme